VKNKEAAAGGDELEKGKSAHDGQHLMMKRGRMVKRRKRLRRLRRLRRL
jgi:hypothetical protein